MEDMLEPQYLFNSLSDKILETNSYFIEPFRQSYAIKELKNVLTERLIGSSDMTRLRGVPGSLS